MNFDSFLRLLQAQLSGVYICDELIAEIMDELKNSGNENTFLSMLRARLSILAQLGVRATEHKEFEPIADGIYSLHLANNFNMRILYAFLPDRRPILLTAFYERGGKKNTSYVGPLKVAKARFQKAKEEYENEPYKC